MTSQERKQKRHEKRAEERSEKRIGALQPYDNFDNITDPDNLINAFKKAKKGVSWKTSVQRYELNRLKNISKTISDLENNREIHKGFIEFDINERGKTRHIRSINIEERVVQKCLCDEVVTPILSSRLIYDNGASLKDKGISFSLNRLSAHLLSFYREHNFSNDGYALTIDFSKFFDRIIHHILIKEQNRYIHNIKLQNLISQLIGVFGEDMSLGLGSQISQISSVFYPNRLDHFIKENLRIKYYGRYMDDLYLIHYDKNYLCQCLLGIRKICDSFGIVINEKKTRISKVSDGFIYLKGKFILTNKGKILQLPLKVSVSRMRRKLTKFNRLLSLGKIKLSDIQNTYKSWRGSFDKRFNAYHQIHRLDEYYNRLFNS